MPGTNCVYARAMGDDPLVVQLHIPLAGKLFLFVLPVLPVAFGLWIALSPSWRSAIYGGLGIIGSVCTAGTVLANRRAVGRGPRQIVATSECISSPMWSIPWGRVARMWIGRSGAGNVRVFNIEPYDIDDIERPQSAFYAINLKLGQQMRIPAI